MSNIWGQDHAQLYIALDAGYLNIEAFKYLNNLAEQCSRLLSSFIDKVKGGSRGGLQFKKKIRDDGFEKMLEENGMMRLEDGRIISRGDA